MRVVHNNVVDIIGSNVGHFVLVQHPAEFLTGLAGHWCRLEARGNLWEVLWSARLCGE